MKITKHLVAFLLTAILASGCVGPGRATIPGPNNMLPAAKGTGPTEVEYPGLLNLVPSLKKGTNNVALKERLIPTADGSINKVTIFYEDVNSSEPTPLRYLYGGGVVIEKVLRASSALLNRYSSIPNTVLQIFNSSKMSLKLVESLSQLQATNIQLSLNAHLSSLLQDQANAIKVGPSTNVVAFDALLAAYLEAYLNGRYVDRLGTTLSQPDITRAGNDTIVPFTAVMIEALYDYSLMTPIVFDRQRAVSINPPTFAVIFPNLYQEISTNSDAPGITRAELGAIRFFSSLSSEEAKHLSSLGSGGVGGNDTLARVISTISQESSRRITEECAYNFFEKFQYLTCTNGYALDERNLKEMGLNADQGRLVLTILQSQDYLEKLLKEKK